ncbi:uncharacterized protein SPSK_04850 [Sporothrix schenckii 1099-18]|uniref:Uncharacterized protein n=1 Tax=Sporothrix schenckii 1099-18 TaxID=1397361 RepID=A0A0F2LWK4_SPOSC|nr:uncharacterized protein SPSK_04850 [Sporothrix schenckii 1099-18]KJR80875.1 hypothetical protein SPSK_04850 [Sporothrix schenckii 1099-18]
MPPLLFLLLAKGLVVHLGHRRVARFPLGRRRLAALDAHRRAAALLRAAAVLHGRGHLPLGLLPARHITLLDLVLVEGQGVDQLALLAPAHLFLVLIVAGHLVIVILILVLCNTQALLAGLGVELIRNRQRQWLELVVHHLVVVHTRCVRARHAQGTACCARHLGLDGGGDNGGKVARDLAKNLDEHGHQLRDGQRQVGRHRVHVLALQTDAQQDALHDTRELDTGLGVAPLAIGSGRSHTRQLGRAQPARKVQVGDRRHQVENQMVVEHVVRIRLQALQVKRRQQRVQFGLGQGRRCAAVGSVVLVGEACRTNARGLTDAQCKHRAKVAELEGQQRQVAPVEVAREGAQPRSVAARGAGLERPQHDTRVLARQLVGRLAQVHGCKRGALPKLEQFARQAVADTNVVQCGRPALRQARKQRRHRLDVAHLDIVVFEQRGLRQLRVGHALHGRRRAVVLEGVQVRLRQVRKLAAVVVAQQLQSARPVSAAHVVGVCGDADNACAGQRRKAVVLELLAHEPGNQVTRGARTAAEGIEHALAADAAFKRHLDDTERLRQAAAVLGDGRHQHEKLVGGGVAHQLQIVGRVFVVTGDVEGDHLLEEALGHGVEGEEGVAVHLQELARRRCWAAALGTRQLGVETQHGVEPAFDGVALGVPDGLRECDFTQRPRPTEATALVVEGILHLGGAARRPVRAHELAHKRQRDGGGLVNDQQLGLAQNVSVLGTDVLDGLAVVAVDVDADNGLVGEVRVGGLDDGVVDVVEVAEGIEAAEDKVEEGLEVLGGGRCNEDVGIAVRHSGSHGNTHGGRLAATAGGRQRHSALQGLLGEGVGEGQEGLGLVESAGEGHKAADGWGVAQRVLELGELACVLGTRAALAAAILVVVVVHVELIVNNEAGVAAAERQDEALVEARHDVGVGFGAVARVDVHGHGVELAQTGHALEQQHDQAAALDGLDGAGQHVGGQGLKVLEDAHAVGVAENLVGLLVIDIANVMERDKQLKGVVGVGLANTALDLLLDLGLALLAVARKVEQLLLVGPEHRLVPGRDTGRGGASAGDIHAGHDVVQVHDHVLCAVADDDEDAALLALDAIADERRDAGVDGFSRHCGCWVCCDEEEKRRREGEGEKEKRRQDSPENRCRRQGRKQQSPLAKQEGSPHSCFEFS